MIMNIVVSDQESALNSKTVAEGCCLCKPHDHPIPEMPGSSGGIARALSTLIFQREYCENFRLLNALRLGSPTLVPWTYLTLEMLGMYYEHLAIALVTITRI